MSRFERWSRRKLGEEVEAAPDKEPAEKAFDEGDAGDAPGHTDESEGVAPGSLDHTLPDPDDLSAGADFSAYLEQGVSRQLRRRALRRLWSAGNYGVRDGLDDYDEDYREILKPLSRDIAEQLRRWTRPGEEASPEPPAEADQALADTTRADVAPHKRKDSAGEAHSEAEADSEDDSKGAPPHKTIAENRLDETSGGGDNKSI